MFEVLVGFNRKVIRNSLDPLQCWTLSTPETKTVRGIEGTDSVKGNGGPDSAKRKIQEEPQPYSHF